MLNSAKLGMIIQGGLILQDLNQMAIEASQNDEALDQLVRQNQLFILKCAAKAAHRCISREDDEWSFALAAFIQAVKNYDQRKGSFPRFAELVIERRLIDYYRSRSRFSLEIAVEPGAFDGNVDQEAGDAPLQAAVAEQSVQVEDSRIKDEIAAVSSQFSGYGFSFFDLTSCSPKAGKTKAACARAVACLLKNPLLISEMRQSRLLPVKIIENQAGVPRKILERHRKYIIAAVEIMTGDYPCLCGYMGEIRKELDG